MLRPSPWVSLAHSPGVLIRVYQQLSVLPDAACTQFDPNLLWRSFGEGWARAASLWSPGGAAPQAASTPLARQPTVRWTAEEELTLLAEMEAAGIAWEEGAEVPKFSTFMPFAATVAHLLGKRSQSGIAQKVLYPAPPHSPRWAPFRSCRFFQLRP